MSLAIFINTSDGFDDCWQPFFTLFDKYAGALRSLPIYLNTERKAFSWPGLNLVCTQVWAAGRVQRLTWGECLSAGLNTVAEPYILYLQEDYFLDRPAREDIIAKTYDKIRWNPDIGVVYLDQHGPQYRNSRSAGPGFVEILHPARYFVNTQAAIWRKDLLISLTRPWENAWTFEKFASLRARRERMKFLSLSPELMDQSPVIEHVHTGIARGKWQAECRPLFASEGIACDFNERGFYRKAGRVKYRLEVLMKLLQDPVDALKSVRSLM